MKTIEDYPQISIEELEWLSEKDNIEDNIIILNEEAKKKKSYIYITLY